MRPPVTLEYLFSCSKVNKDTGCIEWQKGKSGGYGSIYFRGTDQNAHRVAWIVGVGEIKKNLIVCHECDNPSCIKIDHLFLGTQKDNMQDAARKGRIAHGEKSGISKLTEKDVVAIRKANGTNASIAETFSTCESNVSVIRARLTWRHVA